MAHDAAGAECSTKKLEDLSSIFKGEDLIRIKHGKVGKPTRVHVAEREKLNYHSKPLIPWVSKRVKGVELNRLIEVRDGYKTDVCLKNARNYEFQCIAPAEKVFSVVYSHPKYIHKTLDFVAPDQETRDKWIKALNHVIHQQNEKKASFNELEWFKDQFRRADKNRNGKVSFDEMWQMLINLNLQLSEKYARQLFKETAINGVLDEANFVNFCQRLIERKDLRTILSMHSPFNVESFTAKDLAEFLKNIQEFPDVDEQNAAQMLANFEARDKDNAVPKVMGIMGLGRMLSSKWFNIVKRGHDSVFQDMTQPLPAYFCSSSHNTYLTGLQVTGEATVEGYVAALKRGARLLELDLFDGEGAPVITHKRTLIQPITLKDTLQACLNTAFITTPYPVILTLENHVGYVQQKVMAELFVEILGDHLYIPPKDAARRPLPSPHELREKFLLRGKKLDFEADGEEEEEREQERRGSTISSSTHSSSSPTLHPALSALISLPSVKFSSNIYADVKQHAMNGSVSLSENKVEAMFEAAAPLSVYSSQRFVKSYPKGIRQDSSNMNPITSWLCGVSAVALNFQTASEELDLNQGLFRINGGCGWVLKPEILRKGLDVRTRHKPLVHFGVGIISAQYLPKGTDSNDIIDPYVTIEIFGAPKDQWKVKTKIVKDNGFNPQWNESFDTKLYCPELALVRFCVKDFDSSGSNDFVGEYTIPFNSIRPGYSQIRLFTGSQHTLDQSASLLVRIAVDPLDDRYGSTVAQETPYNG